MKSGGREVQAQGTAGAKALGQDCVWSVGGTARRSLWLEQNEQEGEREEVGPGRGWRQVVQGLVDGGGDLGFYPQRRRDGTWLRYSQGPSGFEGRTDWEELSRRRLHGSR